jgi:hypothetical protein
VASLQGIRILSESAASTPSYSFSCGHYLDGLQGVSEGILAHLKAAFETVYEMVAQHLTNSTIAGDMSNQAASLSAWSIIIKAEDHSFLNKIGIFSVLQSVLENARSVSSVIAKQHPFDYIHKQADDVEPLKINLDLVSRFREHEAGIYAVQFLISSQKRLSHLVLSIVHWLASQVALTKDSSGSLSESTAPNALSASLFDLLYAELFMAIRGVMQAIEDSFAPESEGEWSGSL